MKLQGMAHHPMVPVSTYIFILCTFVNEHNIIKWNLVETSAPYAELFEKFCTSSTIHGTYFWFASGSSATKAIWGFIVLFGIVFSAIVINNSFEEWKKHPIMTNVRQAPVEEVDMPSLTICSMDDNRYFASFTFADFQKS